LRIGAHLAVMALVIALITAGCGDSGEDASTSTATSSAAANGTKGSPSKAEYISAADGVCFNGAERSEAEFSEFVQEKAIPKGQEPTSAQFAEVGEQILVPAFQRQVDEIRRLGPAPENPDQIEEYLSGLEEAIKEVEEDPTLAKSPAKVLVDTDKIAQAYGFKVCGNR
jgi:hypothetical protein